MCFIVWRTASFNCLCRKPGLYKQLHNQHLHPECVDEPVQLDMRSAIWNLDLFFGLSRGFPVLGLRISQLRPEVQFFVRLFLHLRKFHLGELHQR